MEQVIFGTLITIAILALGFVAFAAYAIRQNSIPKSDGQEILDPKGIDRGMALVVYQPSSGGGIERAAQLIAHELYHNGYKVVIDRPSIDLSNDVSEYDIIVLGSNVYVGQMSGLILDFASSLSNLDYKTLGLFSNGKLDTSPEFNEIEAILKGHPRIVTAKFVSSSAASPEERACDFVNDLLA